MYVRFRQVSQFSDHYEKKKCATIKNANENYTIVNNIYRVHFLSVLKCFRVPTIDGTEKGTVWPEFTSISSSVLKIDSSKPKIIKNPLADMYKFWDALPIGPQLDSFK